MTEEQVLMSKRRRTRYYIFSAVLIVSVSIFLGAPIIPVNVSLSEYSSHCGAFQYEYTDWQSAGYHLLGIGYHVTLSRSLGCI